MFFEKITYHLAQDGQNQFLTVGRFHSGAKN